MSTSVPFEEMQSSPIGKGSSRGDLVFTREFKVDWDDADTFVAELLFGGTLGMPKQFPGWPGMRVNEVTQEPYIESPTNNATFSDVEIDLVTHEFATIKVSYGPLAVPNANDDLPDGTFAEYEQEEAGEFFEISDGVLLWESDSSIINDIHPTVLIGMTDHNVSWNRVPTPPWSAISALKGRVNSIPFRIPATGQWIAKETLLFMGSKCKKTFNLSTAVPTWSLSYRFRERAIKNFSTAATGTVYQTSAAAAAAYAAGTVYGWNHAYRNSTGGWERRVNASGVPEYSSGSFATLFDFEVGFT